MKNFFLILITFTIMCSCDETLRKGDILCDNVNCSGFGTCKILNEEAHCICETGYSNGENQLECIEDTLKCAITEHEENGACVSNIKMVACIENIPENAFKIDEQVEITWKDGSWEEVSDCAWECNDGYSNINNSEQCELVCIPDCDNKNCGNDTCGGSCGICSETELCNGESICESINTCINLSLDNIKHSLEYPNTYEARNGDYKLSIGFYNNTTPIGHYDLTSSLNNNYSTCEQCILIHKYDSDGNIEKSFYQTEGVLDILEGVGNSGRSKGKITGIKLAEVSIDSEYNSNLVVNGGCIEINNNILWDTTCQVGDIDCIPDAEFKSFHRMRNSAGFETQMASIYNTEASETIKKIKLFGGLDLKSGVAVYNGHMCIGTPHSHSDRPVKYYSGRDWHKFKVYIPAGINRFELYFAQQYNSLMYIQARFVKEEETISSVLFDHINYLLLDLDNHTTLYDELLNGKTISIDGGFARNVISITLNERPYFLTKGGWLYVVIANDDYYGWGSNYGEIPGLRLSARYNFIDTDAFRSWMETRIIKDDGDPIDEAASIIDVGYNCVTGEYSRNIKLDKNGLNLKKIIPNE